jgi:N-methylhydantoinase A
VVEATVTRFGVDVGGTFTDIVAVSPEGHVSVGKVRSTPGGVSPASWVMIESGRAISDAALIHGTTVATNALLERGGADTVLLTTAGFEDILWLRRQDRPSLYNLADDHPAPVVARSDVIGVHERIGADGIVTALEPTEIERVVSEVRRRKPASVAISLLFSFRDPSHEQALAGALRSAMPELRVAASCEVHPVFREFERTSTTAIEAYLRPLVSGYIGRMDGAAHTRELEDFRVMASNGGTLSVRQAQDRAASLALSGPAGGVEGARLVAAHLGSRDLLTLDMGGTSADASVVVAGKALSQASGTVGGLPLALPHILIETVGAGGGSIAWVDAGGALRVGPRSAGARPGPACYGLGGTDATVTDAALVLGWLDPAHPIADELRLDAVLAHEAVARVANEAGVSVEHGAEGIMEVATAAMVRALRRVSVERGIDPRGMTLVAFGGAGPMFACRLAEHLGMSRALIPPHAGVLSALGLALAPARIEFAASVHELADAGQPEHLERVFAGLERSVQDELADAVMTRVADCRYPGQGYELTVDATGGHDTIGDEFHRTHHVRYGHADPSRAVEIVNARVIGTRLGAALELAARPGGERTVSSGSRAVVDDLAAGVRIAGPRTLGAADCTIRIESGWEGTVHETGAVRLERA